MERPTQKQRFNFPKVLAAPWWGQELLSDVVVCVLSCSISPPFFPHLANKQQKLLILGLNGWGKIWISCWPATKQLQLLLQFSLQADAQSTCAWECGPGKGEGRAWWGWVVPELQNNRWSLLIMAAWMSIALPAPFLLLADQYSLNCRRKAVSYTITAQCFNHLDA